MGVPSKGGRKFLLFLGGGGGDKTLARRDQVMREGSADKKTTAGFPGVPRGDYALGLKSSKNNVRKGKIRPSQA